MCPPPFATYAELFAWLGVPSPDEEELVLQERIRAGTITVNEYRAARGLYPVPGGAGPIPRTDPGAP